MKKRYLAIITALFVALTLYIERGAVIVKVLPSALDNIMAAQPFAKLPDGLHISLCGAGGPMPSTNRSGPCVAVIAGEQLFIVDAGTA
jgi:ribonuclease Z